MEISLYNKMRNPTPEFVDNPSTGGGFSYFVPFTNSSVYRNLSAPPPRPFIPVYSLRKSCTTHRAPWNPRDVEICFIIQMSNGSVTMESPQKKFWSAVLTPIVYLELVNRNDNRLFHYMSPHVCGMENFAVINFSLNQGRLFTPIRQISNILNFTSRSKNISIWFQNTQDP